MGYVLAVLASGCAWVAFVAAGLPATACLVIGIIKLCGVQAVQHIGWGTLIGLPLGLYVLGVLLLFAAAISTAAEG